MDEEHPDEFAVTIAHIARDLLSQTSLQQTLNRITRLAVETVPGCDHAGIMQVLPGPRVETTAATSQLVYDSHRAQIDVGEGPCLQAARTDQAYRVIDTRDEHRWPNYMEKALELGIGSMMAFQLSAEEHSRAALNLYSERPYALTVESEQRAWIFASHAAIALLGAREHPGEASSPTGR